MMKSVDKRKRKGDSTHANIDLEEIFSAVSRLEAAAGVGIQTTKGIYKLLGDSIVT